MAVKPKQAKAVGEYFASTNTHFTAIYSSPLKRAHSTAQAIRDAQAEPKPPLIIDPDLKEQHFGIAEGQPWSMKADERITREELYSRGMPVAVSSSKG